VLPSRLQSGTVWHPLAVLVDTGPSLDGGAAVAVEWVAALPAGRIL